MPLKMLIFILITSFTLGGCMSKSQHYYATGDHAAMIREFDSKEGFQALNSIDLHYLCPSFLAMRKYQKSLQCADELESRDKSSVNALGQIFTPSILKVRAYLIKLQTYLDTGDFAKAVEYGEKAYDLAAQGGFSMFTGMDGLGIDILGDLGLAYAVSGNREKAREMIDKLDQYSMSILRGYVFEPYRQLQKIRIAFALKNYDDVLSLCNLNEGIFDGKWWANLPGHRFSYSKLNMSFIKAKSYYESGNIHTADELYTRLLNTPNISESSDIYYYSLADLGSIRLAQARHSEGIELLSKAVDEIELQRSTIATESAKIGFFGDKQTAYKTLIGALFAQGRYKQAFGYVERSKTRALVDMLATKTNFAVQSGDERQVRELLTKQEIEEQEALIGESVSQKRNTRGLIIKTKEQLKSQAGELASLVSVTLMSVEEIQRLIPADETLLEYYYTEKDLYAFVLTSQSLSAIHIETGTLLEDIKDFRKSLGDTSAIQHDEIAKRLHERLIKPLASSLKTPKLIVVAHGALHYIPFYALRDDKDYVIEHYSIRMLPSASVLNYLRGQKPAKPGDILAFGNPDLGEPKFDLIYAQSEAIAVSQTRPHSKVFLRKEATETALSKYGDGFRYIHFATHGEFNADKPLNSALLLAVNAESDGRLTVDKLYSMKLNADLVTLSACETGLGKIVNGDDIVGLTRGFLYTGSSSIVASLWKVDDLATSQLMVRFYKELDRSDKREALRTAQLETKKQYPHPYYWASFQLTGNAQ
ncbi:MAG: CHAT domain-containing protein [Deltaproteobacteria bacterium]|nr:CHAT domain-containing protein [Deltaproteobacteria bacterium]